MLFELFFSIVLVTSSASAGKYLTCKLDIESGRNFTNNRHTIEFWPGYEPNPRWIVDNDDCRYDVKITFIPFQNERMIDYDARNQGALPSLDLNYFSNKNLLPDIERILNKSKTCSYDAVWYDAPSRFYAYHGFKMSAFDSFHNYSWTSYAPVPFLRNVDAAFRDPTTRRIIFISNDWYYTFDVHGGFVKQGHLSYLWSNFRSSPYVDSVLTTRNLSLCRFYDDQVYCTRFDVYGLRLIDEPTDRPRPFAEVFEGGSPAFPLKGSFWVSEKNETALLDSNDVFWIYDINDRLSDTKPFCEYMSFSQLPCCRYYRPANETVEEEHTNATTTTEDYPEDLFWWPSIWGFFLFDGRE